MLSPRPERTLLEGVGDRVRERRHAQGVTQAELARSSGVSVRFLGQLEAGEGNISLARLADVAGALEVSLGSLVSDDTVAPEILDAVRSLVRRRSAAEVREALVLAAALVGDSHGTRIALLGIRGAGKSTVGKRLARKLGVVFLELDSLIEEVGGMPVSAIFELHGEAHYRRLEQQALAKLVASNRSFVVAPGGSIVTSPEAFALLERACLTVWLRARPEDHWERVVAQGDARPMKENPRAMDQLRALYAARTPLYERAAFVVDTPGLTPDDVVREIAARAAP